MRGDPLATRTRHWSRWQRGRLASSWRHGAHLDVLSDEARTAWVCSWQRSGSTLLAEVLTSASGTRLLYEPSNVPHRLFTGEDAARVPLATGPGAELVAIERALAGRLRGPWVDQLCATHVVRRRVVKDVRAMGLLGIVSARHPTVPVVVLVRHPLAVASSAVALGWSLDPSAPVADQLLAEVRRWTSLHGTALREPASSRALVVTYEHLVLEPDETLRRIVTHLGSHHATWRALAVDRSRLAVPSSTSFRRSGERSGPAWVGTFDDVDPRLIDQVTELLAAAGLDALYGAGPEPLVGPDGVADALASR